MSDQSIPLALPSELQSAWRDWQKAFLPVENLRVGRVNAPTYEVEFDLDHQAGYLGALFEAFAAHNPHWDFALRAGGELRDLQTIRAALESSGAGATEVDHVQPLRDGGTHAWGNLQSLCTRCHAEKSRQEGREHWREAQR